MFFNNQRFKIIFFFSFPMYSAFSGVVRGSLVLRHTCHVPPGSGGIACWEWRILTPPCVDTRAKKINMLYITFSWAEIEPTTCRVYKGTCRVTTGLHINKSIKSIISNTYIFFYLQNNKTGCQIKKKVNFRNHTKIYHNIFRIYFKPQSLQVRSILF